MKTAGGLHPAAFEVTTAGQIRGCVYCVLHGCYLRMFRRQQPAVVL